MDCAGEFRNVWNGLVPGAQGIFRADLHAAQPVPRLVCFPDAIFTVIAGVWCGRLSDS